jgi:hypothetical protein
MLSHALTSQVSLQRVGDTIDALAASKQLDSVVIESCATRWVRARVNPQTSARACASRDKTGILASADIPSGKICPQPPSSVGSSRARCRSLRTGKCARARARARVRVLRCACAYVCVMKNPLHWLSGTRRAKVARV